MKKKHLIFYGVVILLLGLLAIWVFGDPDPLQDLKEVETVTENTGEPLAVVDEFMKAVEKKDTRLLAQHMLNGRDSTEVEMLTALLYAEPAFTPVKILHCTRLVKSHRNDNITVYVHSEKRKQTYAVSMLRNKQNKYTVSSIVPSNRKF